MSETLQQICDRIEPILKSDITWTVFEGPGWDPQYGASIPYYGTKKEFVPSDSTCGVCAIGSHVIRHCVPVISEGFFQEYLTDVQAASLSLNVDVDTIRELYLAVTKEDSYAEDERDEEFLEEIWELSRRLRAHGDAETNRKAAPSV